MSSPNRMTLGVGLTAVAIALLAREVVAAEELVVYGRAIPATIRDEQRLLKSDLEQYLRAFNEQLRATLDQDLKRALAPKVELAATSPTRG